MTDARTGHEAAMLRAGMPADLEALFALERSSFAGDRLSRRSLRRFLDSESARLIVAELGGRVVGYCLLLTPAGRSIARIYSIAIAADHRGRGVAGRLLDAAEQAALALGYAGMGLEVRDDNTAAIALYSRRGYVEHARIQGYYHDGAAAIRMRKRLENAQF